MKRRIIFLVSLFVVVVIVASVFSIKGYNEYIATKDHVGKAMAGIQVTAKNTKLRSQAGKDELYLENYKNGNYSFNKPYVVLDPYERAPLSALAVFETDQKAKVSVTVKGKSKDTNISHSYSKYEKLHELPILGLYADTNNEVIITAQTEDGKKKSITIHIQTAALPKYIGTIDVKKVDKDKVDIKSSDLTFVVPSTKYPYAFDTNGDVRWYSSKYNSHVFKKLENGHILFLTKENNRASTYNVLVEMDFLGKLYHMYDFNIANSSNEGIDEDTAAAEATMIHHDAIELPNHNLLLTVNGNSKYIEDVMIELNRETGDIEKEIDLKNLLPKEFYENYTGTVREDGKIDWFHQNAIVYDDSDQSIIVSGRNQDIVMKLDYKTNKIKWILASPEKWPEEYKKYLFKPVGDVKFNAGQHAPVILPDQDNNKDTMDLLLYDNNVVVTRGDEKLSKTFSRGVQYRINEKDKTVKEVWSFGQQFGPAYFTNVVGSTRWLDDSKHRLVDFGYMDQDTRSGIFEVDGEGNVSMEAYVTKFPLGARAYRAERISLYSNEWQYSLQKNAFFVKLYKKILE